MGSVAVRMEGKERLEDGEGGKTMVKEKASKEVGTYMTIAPKQFVKRYRSCQNDITWATKGLVGTALNGESILLIQNRVEDAGFKDIDIIPLGADKVFVHSLSGVCVSNIVGEAK